MTLNVAEARVKRVFRFLLATLAATLVLVIYPFTSDPAGSTKLLVLAVSSTLLGLGYLAAAWSADIPLYRPRIFPGILVAFLVFFLISLLRSEFFFISFLETGWFLYLTVLYLLATQLYETPAQVQRLLYVVCVAVAVASFYGFMQRAGLDPFPWTDRESDVYTNLPATFGNPNFAAHTLILAIVAAIYLAVSRGSSGGGEKKGAWFPPVFLTGIFFIHLGYTRQRAGWIALGAGVLLVVLAVVVGRRLRRPVRAAVVTLILTLFFCALGAVGMMSYYKARTGSLLPLDASLLIRYQSYVSASEMILDRPLLGHGPGVYQVAYSDYWTRFEQEWFAQERRMNAHVHNDLMELAIDAGLPAAGLYLAFLILGISYSLLLAFRDVDRQRRLLGYAYGALFLVFFVDGLFGFNLRVPVSATILFLAAGTLDALWSPKKAGVVLSQAGAGWKAAAVVASVVVVAVAIQQVRDFAADYVLYKAGRSGTPALETLAYLREAESLAPWEDRIPRQRGILLLNQRDVDGAIAAFDTALDRNPHYVLTYVAAAQARMIKAQQLIAGKSQGPEAAVQLLKDGTELAAKALEYVPMLPAAEEVLGKIAMVTALAMESMGHADEAVEASWREADARLQKALAYGAENQSSIYRSLASIRMATRDFAGAHEALVRAAQVSPTDTEIWPLFFEYASAEKRFDQMRDAMYKQIDRLKAEDNEESEAALTTSYLWLARVLEKGNAAEDAIENAYGNAAALQPERPEVWTNYAEYAFRRGRAEQLIASAIAAATALGEAGETVPPQLAAVTAADRPGTEELDEASLALVAAVRGHRPAGELTTRQAYGWAAEILLRRANVVADPKLVCKVFMNLGIVYAGMGDLAEAERLFAKSEACLEGPERGALAVHRADVLVREERLPEALRILRGAQREYPDNLDVRWAVARTLVKLKQFEDARTEYEALLEEPDLSAAGRRSLQEELDALQ